MKKVITGNQAVAYGVILSRVDVISAYPITPQTTIVEELSELIANGRLNTRFLKVESEHSAMAALIGASTGGVRCFTATSSHGLAYMHEMLHWASGARLPIVLVNVNLIRKSSIPFSRLIALQNRPSFR
ncbi:MAG: 2-oxoisovalerate:ferredoxin oxidoreductase alpha subunit [Deltaproteobacteria bacterium]|nr:2-oxoisovalerate:ferredoxin oxidoreductase alpha subunit [Deltaproteobacteria bacterium]